MSYLDKEVQEEAACLSSLDQPLEPVHLMALAQTLAVRFYLMHGYKAPESHNMRDSTHPQERLMWEMGCEAVSLLRATDMQDVQDEYDEELANE